MTDISFKYSNKPSQNSDFALSVQSVHDVIKMGSGGEGDLTILQGVVLTNGLLEVPSDVKRTPKRLALSAGHKIQLLTISH